MWFKIRSEIGKSEYLKQLGKTAKSKKNKKVGF